MIVFINTFNYTIFCEFFWTGDIIITVIMVVLVGHLDNSKRRYRWNRNSKNNI